MMVDVFKMLQELNFPNGKYVVVGGAMAAYGLRSANDLDILVTPDLYSKLLAKGYDQCRCERCLSTSRLILKKGDVDILPNFMLGNYIGDTNSLIKQAEIINGYPFIKLEELAKFKKELGRPKDRKDIYLIEKYLKKNNL